MKQGDERERVRPIVAVAAKPEKGLAPLETAEPLNLAIAASRVRRRRILAPHQSPWLEFVLA